jgi:hypothetical protein
VLAGVLRLVGITAVAAAIAVTGGVSSARATDGPCVAIPGSPQFGGAFAVEYQGTWTCFNLAVPMNATLTLEGYRNGAWSDVQSVSKSSYNTHDTLYGRWGPCGSYSWYRTRMRIVYSPYDETAWSGAVSASSIGC